MKIKLKKPQSNIEAPVLWSLDRDGLTQSMITNWLTCGEKFRLSYVEGYRKSAIGSAPMEFGNCIHELLDMIYSSSRDYDPKEFLSNIGTVIQNSCTTYEQEKYEKIELEGNDWNALALNVGIAEVLLPKYFDYWDSDFTDTKWVALEEVFDITIIVDGRPIRIRGKIDGAPRIKDALWLFETKTKGRIVEEAIIDKLSIDLQVNLYLWALWKKYGEYPAGVIYNIIRRPQLKLGKTETHSAYIARVKADVYDRPEHYFMRNIGSVYPSEIAKWEKTQLIPILREIIRWYDGEGRFKNISACTSGFYPCEFLSICGQGNKSGFTKRTALFEELTVIPVKKIMQKGLDTD